MSIEKSYLPLTKLGRDNFEKTHKLFFFHYVNKEKTISNSFFGKSQQKIILIRSKKRSKNKKILYYIGNKNGYIGYSLKSAKNLSSAILYGSRLASLDINPFQRHPLIIRKNLFFTVIGKLSSTRGSLKLILRPNTENTNKKSLLHIMDLLESVGCSNFHIQCCGKTKAKLNQLLLFIDILRGGKDAKKRNIINIITVIIIVVTSIIVIFITCLLRNHIHFIQNLKKKIDSHENILSTILENISSLNNKMLNIQKTETSICHKMCNIDADQRSKKKDRLYNINADQRSKKKIIKK